jgi:hypothetical protein
VMEVRQELAGAAGLDGHEPSAAAWPAGPDNVSSSD